MSVADTPVTVSATRLKELEELEARLDSMLETARTQAVNDYRLYINNLSRDTKTRAKKQLEKYHAKREEINARRRAAYAAKKAAADAKKE
jgi:hypothetical protein